MVRRYLRAMALAVLMAGAIGTVARQSMDIAVPSICDQLEPGGFWWRFWGCEKESTGGGSGGAS